MTQPKPLLIPWLQTQIDSGKYPGVQWTNTEQTEFSVPWKHALRQDSSDTDVLIFKVTLGQEPHMRVMHHVLKMLYPVAVIFHHVVNLYLLT